MKRLWAFLMPLLIAEAAAILIGGVIFYYTGFHPAEFEIKPRTYDAFLFGALVGFAVLSIPALIMGALVGVANLFGNDPDVTMRKG